MDDNTYNFYDVVDSANAYFATHPTGKGSGYKDFQRWKNENESKFYPTGNRLDADYNGAITTYMEFYNSNRYKHAKAFENGWKELGPWDANNITEHYSPGIGRVEDFWVNPNNENHIYLCSRSGGFWRTTDGGKTWENTTDTLVASGVVSLDVNPKDKNDILIAVAQGGNRNTHGVYRSKDGGTTWELTKFNPSSTGVGGLGRYNWINKVKFHPTRDGLIYVTTTSGYYVSKDDLKTITKWINESYTDIEFHPTKPNVMYVYKNSGTDRNYVKYSTDTGATYTNSAELLNNNNAKIFLAVSKAEPNHVYAASNNGVWKSVNSGLFWTFLSNPDESCQGFAVSDQNVSNMVYGYVDTEVSTDGGNKFTQKTSWSNRNAAYVHADIRAAECVNGTFYLGTDGYLAKSTNNGNTWTRLCDGVGIREFYAVGISQSKESTNMAGSQDNGTSIYSANKWLEWNGGDGMEALVQPLNSDWMIGSWQYGARNYTRDGGYYRYVVDNPKRGSGNAEWEAPLLMNHLHQKRVYHFSDSIFVSDDFGITWNFYSFPDLTPSNNRQLIKDADIAYNSSGTMVVARNSAIKITTDDGKTWKDIKSNLPNYSITDIAFDPNNDSTIVVTYNRYQNDGAKVFITYNQGGTWSNITHNLNNMPLFTVVMDHTDSSNIYVGSEIGIYYKPKNSTTWTLYNKNLPNVTVKDLEIQFGSNTLRAATWGRGLWENSLVGKQSHPRILEVTMEQPFTDHSPSFSIPNNITADIESSSKISSAMVYWSLDGIGLENAINMSKVSGNVWQTDSGIPSSKLAGNIYYRVVAQATDGGKAESYRFHYEITPYEYCEGRGNTATGGDWINFVSLNNVENASDKSYYSDFTDSIVNLYQNEDYSIEVGLNFHYDIDTVAAWIDYDNNRSFDADEAITLDKINSSHGTFGLFTVPADALLDTILRMRVVNRYTRSWPMPCGVDVSGEVEDYSVRITKNTTGVSTIANDLKTAIFPNPAANEFTILLDKDYDFTSCKIISLTGNVVCDKQFESKKTLNISLDVPAGMYIVLLEAEGKTSRKKLIIK